MADFAKQLLHVTWFVSKVIGSTERHKDTSGSTANFSSLFKISFFAFFLSVITIPFSDIYAAVFDITPSDVTTRALSVVWVSDEPVTSATIRVYSDIDAIVDLTPGLIISVDSSSVTNAHTQGIVKVTASGLSPDTDYFIQSETTGSSGTLTTPAASSLLLVHTALETTKVNSSNAPIVNDVLTHDVFFPDGVTPAPGTLVIAQVDNLSAYPLTAFTGENSFAPQTAAIDTNNFFGTDGRSLELIADDALKVSVFRGLICSTDFSNHSFFSFRRTPEHLETPAITELETPFNCFTSDTVCDNDINILDVQIVVSSIDTRPGDCGFNPDMDLIADGDINILDVQRVVSDIDTTVPNRP